MGYSKKMVGEPVIFVDEVQQPHAALVTADWALEGSEPGAVNLVFVSGDESQDDPYGRQIVRKTSVTHESKQSAPGYFWREA